MNYPAVIQNPLLKNMQSKPDLAQSKLLIFTHIFCRNFLKLGKTLVLPYYEAG